MALTPNQCIHYALTRPAVASVLAGARTLEELESSLAYETASDGERDFAAAFAAMPKISWQGHCMYCVHCAPCPMGIDVASVTKFWHLAVAQGEVPETVREHYAALPHTAGECVACGACESRQVSLRGSRHREYEKGWGSFWSMRVRRNKVSLRLGYRLSCIPAEAPFLATPLERSV
ncbi:MAG: hypothetical protein ACLSHU_07985 [Oscillospiraceae bacterium]